METVSCPVCGDAPFTIFWRGKSVRESGGQQTRYVRCSSCGLVYASPRASYALRHAWLDDTFTVTPALLRQLQARKPALELESAFIKRFISRGRLLDIGCSTGDFFSAFSAPAWELHGVELVESAARYAREAFNSKVHCGTLPSASYPDGFFDLVTLIDTFYYVDDPASELAEIARVLRPHGLLSIEIAGQTYALWRNYGWAARLFDQRDTRADSDSSYLYWFNYRALRRSLRRAGFEIVGSVVIPSPVSPSPMVRILARMHFEVARRLSKTSARFYDWAPKWMVLARKQEAGP